MWAICEQVFENSVADLLSFRGRVHSPNDSIFAHRSPTCASCLSRAEHQKKRQGQQMDKEQYQMAKAHLVACMQQGQPWQQASAPAGLRISQSNAYRLMKAVRQHGETALKDGRHGHPVKLRGEVRAFLEDACRKALHTPSSLIQRLFQERFGVSQINRVRAALGISNHANNQGKKHKGRNAHLLNQYGKTVLAVFCYSLLPIKRACSPSFKQPSHQAALPLIHHCVLPTIRKLRCAVRC